MRCGVDLQLFRKSLFILPNSAETLQAKGWDKRQDRKGIYSFFSTPANENGDEKRKVRIKGENGEASPRS